MLYELDCLNDMLLITSPAYPSCERSHLVCIEHYKLSVKCANQCMEIYEH
jgi:hypothetical protein